MLFCILMIQIEISKVLQCKDVCKSTTNITFPHSSKKVVLIRLMFVPIQTIVFGAFLAVPIGLTVSMLWIGHHDCAYERFQVGSEQTGWESNYFFKLLLYFCQGLCYKHHKIYRKLKQNVSDHFSYICVHSPTALSELISQFYDDHTGHSSFPTIYPPSDKQKQFR